MVERRERETQKNKNKTNFGRVVNPPKKVPSKGIMVPVRFNDIDFQKIKFYAFHEVTKNKRDLGNLRFIFRDCNSDLGAGCFGSKIRVFKFGFRERPSSKPSYIVVMLNEVKDRIVNEKVKGNLYKLSNDVIIFSCYFKKDGKDGVFTQCQEIYNVARRKGNKHCLIQNLECFDSFNLRKYDLISPNKLVWR